MLHPKQQTQKSMKSKRSRKDKALRKGIKKNGLILRALFDEQVRQFKINAIRQSLEAENTVEL